MEKAILSKVEFGGIYLCMLSTDRKPRSSSEMAETILRQRLKAKIIYTDSHGNVSANFFGVDQYTDHIRRLMQSGQYELYRDAYMAGKRALVDKAKYFENKNYNKKLNEVFAIFDAINLKHQLAIQEDAFTQSLRSTSQLAEPNSKKPSATARPKGKLPRANIHFSV